MPGRYEQAELLVALWRLGDRQAPMPTSHGILDRTLCELRSDLPETLADLSFSTTGVGLRCFELPDILLAAQEAMLTSEPNPTYQATLITLEPDEASEIAINYGLDLALAQELGAKLVELSEEIRAKDAGQFEDA
ncbi:MAG: hypothetical protein AAF687_00390 [Pseudomonadota bacterium]